MRFLPFIVVHGVQYKSQQNNSNAAESSLELIAPRNLSVFLQFGFMEIAFFTDQHVLCVQKVEIRERKFPFLLHVEIMRRSKGVGYNRIVFNIYIAVTC